jgi:hypothetical protein
LKKLNNYLTKLHVTERFSFACLCEAERLLLFDTVLKQVVANTLLNTGVYRIIGIIHTYSDCYPIPAESWRNSAIYASLAPYGTK